MAVAAVILPDTAGNILVPGNYDEINGQDQTIQAIGGLVAPNSVVIDSGVIFTGDTIEQNGIEVSAAGYTIANSGSITGGTHGLDATGFAVVVQNSGTLEGLVNEGIHADGAGSLITNFDTGVIRGGDDAIYFGTDGGEVINHGDILGVNSSGIQGQNTVAVTNYGLILADDHGIDVVNDLTLANYGVIESTLGDGVQAGTSAVVENLPTYQSGILVSGGSITGAVNGVSVGDTSEVNNEVAGEITGGVDGVVMGADSLLSNTGGTIEGTTGNGVTAGSGADISNYDSTVNGTFFPGSITGALNGIQAGTDAVIENDASIVGTTGSGVAADAGLTLYNYDEITGNAGVTATGGDAYLYNRGDIEGTGGTAILLGDTGGVGANVVDLADGGTIDGDVIATGSGNVLNGDDGTVYGDLSGIQNINVLSSGYLQVFGDITGPATITAAVGSQLSGEGEWEATIELAQDSLIYASDILEIDGDVNHAAGSFLGVLIQPELAVVNDGTDHGLIVSTGGIYDASDAIVEIGTTSGLALRNAEYVLVEKGAGSVLGGGNDIVYAGSADTLIGNYFGSISLNGGGDLVLGVDHAFAALPGLSGNEQSLGAVFDQFMDVESGLPSGASNDLPLRGLIGYLDRNDLATAQEVLGAIIGPAEASLAVTESVVNSNYRLHRLTQDHLAAARSGGETVTRTTPPSAPVTDSKGGLVDSKGGGVTASQTSTETIGGRGNVWGTYSYDRQDFTGLGGNSDFDGEVNAFTAGFDYRVAPNLILGILVDGSKSDIDWNPGNADIESVRAAIYGSWGGQTGLYSDFLFGYGDHDLDFTDANSLQALATIGYAMGDQHVKHGPFIGAEWQKVDVDGFDYNNVIPVSVRGYDIDSLRGLVGYRVNANLGRFRPYASVAYAHEFKDDQTNARATISNTSFRVDGAERSSAVIATAGAGISLSRGLVLDLAYRGEYRLEDEGLNSHGGSIGLNYSF